MRGNHMDDNEGAIPEPSLSEWHELFNLCANAVDDKTITVRYAESVLKAIRGVKPELKPGLGLIYDLNAALYCLKLLILPAKSTSTTYHANFMGYYNSVAVKEMQDSIGLILGEPLPLGPEQQGWTVVLQTLDFIRNEMLNAQQDQIFGEPYYQLWQAWIVPNIKDKNVFLRELELLEQAGKQPGSSVHQKALIRAQCWMYYRLSDDRMALELLKQAQENTKDYYVFILNILGLMLMEQDWTRLLDWLITVGPLLESRYKDVMDSYAGYWSKTVEQLPECEERMWSTLREMLPYSERIYEQLMIELGQWRQWMDLQLSNNVDPLAIRATDLKPLEKNAPEVLLPFYHQAVERYVLEKNRGSYKKAVRLLKRLSKLYTKMKLTARWEQFIDSFTDKHSRLRALQEELRKGKLIP